VQRPDYVRFMRRLASIARVIVFDRRGMGLSDPVAEAPSVEERVRDIRSPSLIAARAS
jgi:hypothetical protein